MKHYSDDFSGSFLEKLKKGDSAAVFSLVTVIALLGLATYQYFGMSALSKKVGILTEELASTSAKFVSRSDDLAANITDLRQETLGISSTLSLAQQNIAATQQNVASVQSQVGGVQQTVGQISGTVSTLEKLSKADPELLRKYSKVFFLNEHYVPERVTEISKENLYYEDKPEVIHSSVWPYLSSMLESAGQNGMNLYVLSAYRSFSEQHNLKAAYRVTYGAGTANQFSADQGYSEHQLGTTVDFITTGLGGELYGFEKTLAYQWLIANAHRYGFTLSYPPNNSYYIFEPWHWRFVGVKLATDLHNQGKYFYDLDQRVIDEYLIDLF